jgi:23S rRNA pseudouridine2605 synthase
MLERLHKVLARAGVAALRPAEDMIMAGRVTVNGRVVRELGARVDPDNDHIAVDGTIVDVPPPSDARRYVLLHKPVGVISTAQDTHGRPTVVDLIPSDERLFPVGRLDADSEGLILLTNDGDVAYRLTHPRFEVEKEYRVLLDRTPDVADLRRWRDGVELDGQITLPVWAEILDRTPDGTWVRIVMREGRNRQIRNVAQLLGYDVLRLIRVREGALGLGDLEPGQWRELTAAEADGLRAHVRHIPGPEAEQHGDERAPMRERAVNERQRDDNRDRGAAERRPRPAFGERDRGAGERRPRPAFSERAPTNQERRPRADTNERRTDDRSRSPLSDRRSDDRPRSIRDVGRSADRRPAGASDRRGAGPTRDRAPFGSRERSSGPAGERSSFGSRERTGGPRSRSNEGAQRDGGSTSSMRSGLGRGDQRSTSSMRSGLGRSGQSAGRRSPERTERAGSPYTRSGESGQQTPSGPRGRSLTRPGGAQRSTGPRNDRPSSGGQRADRSPTARGGYRSDSGNARSGPSQRGSSGAGRPQRPDGPRAARPTGRPAPARRPTGNTDRPARPARRRDDEE